MLPDELSDEATNGLNCNKPQRLVQAKMSQGQTNIDPITQQVGLLNLRINDMLTQLNVVIKTLIDENASLKKENADPKAAPK